MVVSGPVLSESSRRGLQSGVPLGDGPRVTEVVFIPTQNCPQHTRMASMFAEESKEQILSVGPIRRKRKCA